MPKHKNPQARHWGMHNTRAPGGWEAGINTLGRSRRIGSRCSTWGQSGPRDSATRLRLHRWQKDLDTKTTVPGWERVECPPGRGMRSCGGVQIPQGVVQEWRTNGDTVHWWPSVTSCGEWQNEQDHRYKQPKPVRLSGLSLRDTVRREGRALHIETGWLRKLVKIPKERPPWWCTSHWEEAPQRPTGLGAPREYQRVLVSLWHQGPRQNADIAWVRNTGCQNSFSEKTVA